MEPFGSPSIGSRQFTIGIYGLLITVYQLLGWLRKRFRTSNLDTMTLTTLEAIAPNTRINDFDSLAN